MPEWISYIVFLAGFLFVAYFAHSYLRSKDSARWTPVAGRIEKAEISVFRNPNAQNNYKPVVKYQYGAQGQILHGSTIHFGDSLTMNTRRAARKTVEKYFPGKEVMVYYDPAKPSRSVLEPGIHPIIYLALAGGIICMAISLLLYEL